jgi:hypothetical protein
MFSNFAMALSASLLVRAKYSRISWARRSVWPVMDTISGRVQFALASMVTGGAAYVVEVKTGNPGGFTGFRALFREVSLLKRQPGFRGQYHGRPSRCRVQRGLQRLGAGNANDRLAQHGNVVGCGADMSLARACSRCDGLGMLARVSGVAAGPTPIEELSTASVADVRSGPRSAL